jgi:hypothetical protein
MDPVFFELQHKQPYFYPVPKKDNEDNSMILRRLLRLIQPVPVQSGVRISSRRTFETDRKPDILGTGLVYITTHEGSTGLYRGTLLHLT